MRRTGVRVALESLPSFEDDFARAMFGGAPRAFFGMSFGGKGLSVEVLTASGVVAGDKTVVIGLKVQFQPLRLPLRMRHLPRCLFRLKVDLHRQLVQSLLQQPLPVLLWIQE